MITNPTCRASIPEDSIVKLYVLLMVKGNITINYKDYKTCFQRVRLKQDVKAYKQYNKYSSSMKAKKALA